MREERLDRLLPASQFQGRPSKELLSAADDWSSAVWRAAEEAGPYSIHAEHLSKGISLARRPVFVCGVHRSGTTLVRDLLDGHPQLSVLPSEGSFLTSLRRKIAVMPSREKMRFLGCEWIRRLANPINQPPNWLLGRTTNHDTPYVTFARIFMGWWSALEYHFGANTPLWPHIAIALAYTSFFKNLENNDEVHWWVEKTPTNEFYLQQLWDELPKAKVIHVVRNPIAIYASRKRMEVQTFGTFNSARTVLKELGRSHKIAAESIEKSTQQAYLVIRYEDVVQEPQQFAKRIAVFLDIEMHPTLLRPTVANLSAYSNSSFRQDQETSGILADAGNTNEDLTDAELELIAAYVGESANVLGYEMKSLKASRDLKLKLKLYLTGNLGRIRLPWKSHQATTPTEDH